VREACFVAGGGAIGALARYGVGLFAARLFGNGFPWGTLLVNVVGCFAMGIVLEVLLDLESHTAEAITPAIKSQTVFWRQGIAIGFLGGLTTFSTFGADTIRELDFKSGQPMVGLMNIAANVLLSLVAVWLGMAVMRAVD
jgi:CrcB protein